MAWTSWGFDGTINEAQWAQMAGLLGNGYVAAGNGDCLVTAVGGARSVSVAAGTLYGDGVVSTNSAAETVAMTTPVNGQWYVISLRRTWATNTVALVAIAGATTTTTTPTAPPTSFPTLNTNVGVLTDQPIAWAWCNSANTTVVIFDIRLFPVKTLPPVVSNSIDRNAKFPTPTQGTTVWQNDLGAQVTYLDAYNSSTNPGGGESSGWFRNTRTTGIVPMMPTNVTNYGTGSSASVNYLGVISFASCTSININGIFNSGYKNYRIIIDGVWNSQNAANYIRFTSGGTPNQTLNYFYAGTYGSASGSSGTVSGISQSRMLLGSTDGVGVDDLCYITMDVLNPNGSTRTVAQIKNTSYIASLNYITYNHSGVFNSGAVFDGIAIIPDGGTIGASSLQIFGYND